jgi:hypothetical protein
MASAQLLSGTVCQAQIVHSDDKVQRYHESVLKSGTSKKELDHFHLLASTLIVMR